MKQTSYWSKSQLANFVSIVSLIELRFKSWSRLSHSRMDRLSVADHFYAQSDRHQTHHFFSYGKRRVIWIAHKSQVWKRGHKEWIENHVLGRTTRIALRYNRHYTTNESGSVQAKLPPINSCSVTIPSAVNWGCSLHEHDAAGTLPAVTNSGQSCTSI